MDVELHDDEWTEEDERKAERAARLAAATAALAQLDADLGKIGLTIRQQKSPYHFQIFRRGSTTVVAQWWPNSGKTMDGNRKGQHCTTAKALLSWLTAKVAR